MKINWGTGIVLGIIGFIAFIMFLVISMMTDDKFDHELVVEEYYKKELVYQQEIDAQQNAQKFSADIRGQRTPDGWLLSFPSEMENDDLEGTVFLYRPSNKVLDFNLPLVISNSQLLIPDNRLVDGRWDITIDWKVKDKRFVHKKSIVY